MKDAIIDVDFGFGGYGVEFFVEREADPYWRAIAVDACVRSSSSHVRLDLWFYSARLAFIYPFLGDDLRALGSKIAAFARRVGAATVIGAAAFAETVRERVRLLWLGWHRAE